MHEAEMKLILILILIITNNNNNNNSKQLCILLNILHNFRSLANTNSGHLIKFARSLINIKNSNGPTLEPCGTPVSTKLVKDLTPLYLIN